MATLLKGAPVAQALSKKIEQDCRRLRSRGVVPTFGIVRVGEEPDDLAYERGACRRAETLGVAVEHFVLPAHVTEEALIQTLERINADPRIHGCLLMRPLPPHLDTVAVGRVLRPEKDVDAVTVASMGGMLSRAEVGFAPCTATACLELLHYYQIPLQGKKTVGGGQEHDGGAAHRPAADERGGHRVGVPHPQRPGGYPAAVPGGRDHHLRRRPRPADHPGLREARPGDRGCGGSTWVPTAPCAATPPLTRWSPSSRPSPPSPAGVGAVTATVLVGHAVQAALRQTEGA